MPGELDTDAVPIEPVTKERLYNLCVSLESMSGMFYGYVDAHLNFVMLPTLIPLLGR